MRLHHTKNKGDLGVLKIKADLCEKGFLVLSPESEHAPFDLVVYKEGMFKRVQAKYRNLKKSGVLEIPFRSSYSTSKGVISTGVNKNEIDVYAVFCPEMNECYYFNPNAFNKSLTLRVKTPLNSQHRNVKMADQFREVP